MYKKRKKQREKAVFLLKLYFAVWRKRGNTTYEEVTSMEKKYGYLFGMLALGILGTFAVMFGKAHIRRQKIEGVTKAVNEVVAGISKGIRCLY